MVMDLPRAQSATVTNSTTAATHPSPHKKPRLLPQPPTPKTDHHHHHSTEEKNHFDNLSTELVAKIFSHLEHSFLITNVSLSCKRFKDICLDASLWHNLLGKIPKNPPKALELIGRCRQLERLTLDRRDDVALLAAKAIECCPGLRFLYIMDDEDNPGVINQINHLFETITKFGKNVFEIMLDGEWDSVELSDEAAKGLRNINNLTLSSYKEYDSRIWKILGDNCKKLETFNYMHAPVKEDCLATFCKGVAETLVEFNIENSRISNGAIKHVGKWCKSLGILNVNFCIYSLSPEDLDSISELRDLWHLCLYCPGVEDTAKAVDLARTFEGKKLAHLWHLDIREAADIDDTVIKAIANNCQKLRYLDISFGQSVSDAGVADMLKKCKELKELGVFCHVSSVAFSGAKANLQRLAVQYDDGDVCVKDMEAIRKVLPKVKLLVGDLEENKPYPCDITAAEGDPLP